MISWICWFATDINGVITGGQLFILVLINVINVYFRGNKDDTLSNKKII